MDTRYTIIWDKITQTATKLDQEIMKMNLLFVKRINLCSDIRKEILKFNQTQNDTITTQLSQFTLMIENRTSD